MNTSLPEIQGKKNLKLVSLPPKYSIRTGGKQVYVLDDLPMTRAQ